MLHEETDGQAVITTGVGQHQMWAAQWYDYDLPRHWATSGELQSQHARSRCDTVANARSSTACQGLPPCLSPVTAWLYKVGMLPTSCQAAS